MDHSHSQEQLWGAVEIIPNRLYYAPLKFIPSESGEADVGTSGTTTKKEIHYFSIDTALVYWNFFLDFGPLNLGQLYRFCSLVNHKLVAPEFKDCILCYHSGPKGEQKANAAFLICAYQMLYLGRGLEEAYFGFRDDEERKVADDNMQGIHVSLPPRWRTKRMLGSGGLDSEGDGTAAYSIHNTGSSQQHSCPFARIHPLPPFHDASPIVCTYDLSVYDCLCGLDKARQLGFFKYGNTPNNLPTQSCPTDTITSPNHPSPFNVDEYEYFEQVENGDLNWIVQNKILAFAGPQSHKLITPEGFCMLTPADYIPYFLKQNVKLVIRLNKKCYDENDFEKVGIRHVQHYYLDGSCPEMRILQAVVADMESVGEQEAIAIHCKAGLGRTGTCIGAYLMKHYRLTAREVIGWMRICRPGMVIGPQQHFLQEIEGIMWQEGEVFRSNLLKSAELAASACVKQKDTAHPSILATPQSKGLHAGQHVKIVTPDTAGSGILRPSANASQDDVMTGPVNDDIASPIPSSPSSTNSLPTMDVLKVQEPSSSDDTEMKEGDQANALLERKLRQNLDHQFMS
jgi:cell division cycle 14